MTMPSSQIADADLSEGNRESRRNRTGRTRYICISNGRDQRTERIDSLWVRFWVRKMFEKKEGHPIHPHAPAQEAAGILIVAAARTARMLSG
jgi:hypothetical protein